MSEGAADRLQWLLDGELAELVEGRVQFEMRASTRLDQSLVAEVLNEEGAGLADQGISVVLSDSDWRAHSSKNPCPVFGALPLTDDQGRLSFGGGGVAVEAGGGVARCDYTATAGGGALQGLGDCS